MSTKIRGRKNTYWVRDVADLYSITPRRVRAIAEARGIGSDYNGQWGFTWADVQALRPGPGGNPGRGMMVGLHGRRVPCSA